MYLVKHLNLNQPVMKKACLHFVLLLLSASVLSHAQGNALLKKYSGAYYLLNFGEETANASTEKINFTLDGKWTSVSFPVDGNGEVSKVPVKKSGTWEASEGTIQMNSNGTATEFKLDGGLFLGSDTFLQKIFASK